MNLPASETYHPKSSTPRSTAGTGYLEQYDVSGQVVRTWKVQQSKIRLGTSEDCEIQIELPGVTDVHAILIFSKRHSLVRGLGGPISVHGRPIREWLFDRELTFELAGCRFRAVSNSPIANLPARSDQTTANASFDPTQRNTELVERLVSTVFIPLKEALGELRTGVQSIQKESQVNGEKLLQSIAEQVEESQEKLLSQVADRFSNSESSLTSKLDERFSRLVESIENGESRLAQQAGNQIEAVHREFDGSLQVQFRSLAESLSQSRQTESTANQENYDRIAQLVEQSQSAIQFSLQDSLRVLDEKTSQLAVSPALDEKFQQELQSQSEHLRSQAEQLTQTRSMLQNLIEAIEQIGQASPHANENALSGDQNPLHDTVYVEQIESLEARDRELSDALKEAIAERDAAKQDLGELHTQMQKLQTELANRQSELEEQQTLFAATEQSRQDSSSQPSISQEQLDALEAQTAVANDLQTQLETLQQQLQQRETDYLTLKQEAEENAALWQNAVDEVKSENAMLLEAVQANQGTEKSADYLDNDESDAIQMPECDVDSDRFSALVSPPIRTSEAPQSIDPNVEVGVERPAEPSPADEYLTDFSSLEDRYSPAEASSYQSGQEFEATSIDETRFESHAQLDEPTGAEFNADFASAADSGIPLDNAIHSGMPSDTPAGAFADESTGYESDIHVPDANAEALDERVQMNESTGLGAALIAEMNAEQAVDADREDLEHSVMAPVSESFEEVANTFDYDAYRGQFEDAVADVPPSDDETTEEESSSSLEPAITSHDTSFLRDVADDMTYSSEDVSTMVEQAVERISDSVGFEYDQFESTNDFEPHSDSANTVTDQAATPEEFAATDFAQVVDSEAFSDEPSDYPAEEIEAVEQDNISDELEEPRKSESSNAFNEQADSNLDPVSGDEDDDSVEAYMQRLLARVKGDQDSSPPAKTMSAKPEKTESAKPSTFKVATLIDQKTEETANEPASKPLTAAEFKPRGAAAERNSNMAAMRELANSSARTAIERSVRQRSNHEILFKSSVAIFGFVAATVLFLVNGFTVSIALAGTAAGYIIAGLWGYEALVQARTILSLGPEASHASDHIQPPFEDEGEVEDFPTSA